MTPIEHFINLDAYQFLELVEEVLSSRTCLRYLLIFEIPKPVANRALKFFFFFRGRVAETVYALINFVPRVKRETLGQIFQDEKQNTVKSSFSLSLESSSSLKLFTSLHLGKFSRLDVFSLIWY